MTRTRFVASTDEAVADVADGSTVLVGGFGLAGMPFDLVEALIGQGATDLTVVSNNAGNGEVGLAALLKAGRVRKVVCSFPRQSDSYVFDELYRSGRLELEVVPQGNLAERMRAAVDPEADAAGPAPVPSTSTLTQEVHGRSHHARARDHQHAPAAKSRVRMDRYTHPF
jgi:3-oxoacid CoA-transferase A subunit